MSGPRKNSVNQVYNLYWLAQALGIEVESRQHQYLVQLRKLSVKEKDLAGAKAKLERVEKALLDEALQCGIPEIQIHKIGMQDIEDVVLHVLDEQGNKGDAIGTIPTGEIVVGAIKEIHIVIRALDVGSEDIIEEDLVLTPTDWPEAFEELKALPIYSPAVLAVLYKYDIIRHPQVFFEGKFYPQPMIDMLRKTLQQ